MGGARNGLIPAAILLDNPGSNIWELSQKFNRLKVNNQSFISRYKGKDPELRTCPVSSLYFSFNLCHQGIYGVISALGIEQKSEFPEEINGDSYLRLSGLEVIPKYGVKDWEDPWFRVLLYKGENKAKKSEIIETPVFKVFKEGKMLEGLTKQKIIVQEGGEEVFAGVHPYRDEKQLYLVEEVLSTRFEERGGHKVPFQKLKIRELYLVYEVQKFRKLSDLLRKHPWASPEKLFDLEQKAGEIVTNYGQEILKEGTPKWFQKEGEYYLNLEDLMRRNMEHTYSSIILTAEAIKNNFWEVLEYQSGDEYPEVETRFLLENPEAHRRYLRELRSWWESRDAFLRGLTTTELLRKMALAGEVNLEGEIAFLEQDYPELKKRSEARKTLEREAFTREVELNKEEVPF